MKKIKIPTRILCGILTDAKAVIVDGDAGRPVAVSVLWRADATPQSIGLGVEDLDPIRVTDIKRVDLCGGVVDIDIESRTITLEILGAAKIEKRPFRVHWNKMYVASGSMDVEAYSSYDAELEADRRVGGEEGSRQYLPDKNTYEVETIPPGGDPPEIEGIRPMLDHAGQLMAAEKSTWEDDSIQFPRVIGEAQAASAFTEEVIDGMCESMDLERADLHELLGRATRAWEARKVKV